MATWKKVLLGFVAVVIALVVTCLGIFGPCWSGWIRWGVLVDECPTGVLPRTHAEMYGMGRGLEGTVSVAVYGQQYDADLHPTWETEVRRFSVELSLLDGEGKATPIVPEKRWKNAYGQTLQTTVILPKDLPDDDYRLRVVTDSAAGPSEVDLPLPLFKPAIEHTLTDAPLYRPGQVVKFRAVLLGRGDFGPLESRPGTWRVRDPHGELILEERGRTGAFGVVDSTFPLTADAESGTWTVSFDSGAAMDVVGFEVKEFKLPRFTVALSSPKPWHPVGDTIRVEGVATYASGAPVAGGTVSLGLGVGSGWPPPSTWLEPRSLTTDSAGRFSAEWGPIPDDLRETATISAGATVADDTGDSAWATMQLTLSRDPLVLDAVTELEDGLVPDTNNRMYVRVTTPDGKPLPDVKLRLRRAWDERDEGIEAVTDADAVAKFQLDPGQPITVVEPERPYRPPVRTGDLIELRSASTQPDGQSLSLADLAAVDRWRAAMTGCADMTVAGGQELTALVVLSPDGGMRWAEVGTVGPAARCVARTLRAQRGPTGRARALQLDLRVNDPGGPEITAVADVVTGPRSEAMEEILDVTAQASVCVRDLTAAADVPMAWAWRVEKGERRVITTPLARDVGTPISSAQTACIVRAVGTLELTEPASALIQGVLRFTIDPRIDPSASGGAPETYPGFHFRASIEGVGEGDLRLREGSVPPLRLRLSEVVVDAGDEVELTAIRGPSFEGSFPEKMQVMQGTLKWAEFPFDAKKRTGKFKVPDDASGFGTVDWGNARAILYVRPRATLEVALAAEPPTWRPGEDAKLLVSTTGPAGVTLSGIDATMSTLAPLPEADAFSRVTVLAQGQWAFGVLDAAALQTGQVQGDNAAQAAVLRVEYVPAFAPGEDALTATADGVTDLDTPLGDAFYTLYAVVREEVRAWERKAPEGELLTAQKMVELWEKALAKSPAEDPFGRPMHLRKLPVELRRLADPRLMVADAARLPEDVENWDAWVVEESP